MGTRKEGVSFPSPISYSPISYSPISYSPPTNRVAVAADGLRCVSIQA